MTQFEGASTLKRREVLALIEWTGGHHRDLRHRAVQGLTEPAQWGHARRRIKKALSTPNPVGALDFVLEECGGIEGWGPYVGSLVLAACSPRDYAIADPRSLVTLEALRLYTPSVAGDFSRSDWWPYLHLCRRWARECSLTPRQVSQALSVAAAEAPNLPRAPKKSKSRRTGS